MDEFTKELEKQITESAGQCYDWLNEEKNKTFVWFSGSWNILNAEGNYRRIYYCPMCGKKLPPKSL